MKRTFDAVITIRFRRHTHTHTQYSLYVLSIVSLHQLSVGTHGSMREINLDGRKHVEVKLKQMQESEAKARNKKEKRKLWRLNAERLFSKTRVMKYFLIYLYQVFFNYHVFVIIIN